MKMQERLKEEEAKLQAMQDAEDLAKEDKNSSDSFVSEKFSDSEDDDSFMSKSSKTASKDDDREKEED